MSIYLGKNKIGITKYENLDTELTEQEELLNDLEADVNALEDKPKSDVQYMIDQTNSCKYLFYQFAGTELDYITTKLDTSKVTDMSYMFSTCQKLENLDLSNFDTSNVIIMSQMFYNSKALITLDLSNFNTSSVTDMSSMFSTCSALTSLDLSNWDTRNVTTMSGMFNNCSSLTSLDLSNFNTSELTNMGNMFYNCNALTNLDLTGWDTSKVTGYNNTFRVCMQLETISNIDLISATNVNAMFTNCTNLTNVTLKNIKKSIQLGSGTSYGTLLTNDSLINTIQELWDLTGQTSQTLTLSTTSKNNIANIYVKLITPTAEQIEADPNIESKKPCEVCESTDDGAMLITEYLISKHWALA